MGTVKVKFRPSTAIDKEGKIYYQVIHERKPRQIATEYKVYAHEWNKNKAAVSLTGSESRIRFLQTVREHIKMDTERLKCIMQNLEKTRHEFTVDEIVEEYWRIMEQNTLFRYMDRIIAKLRCDGRIRTAETYRAALNSFKNFHDGKDILLDDICREVVDSYEAWQKLRNMAPNTRSFYTRILRAVYNRAVDDGLTKDRSPFRKAYTGVEKTLKRALPLNMIKKIKSLDLTFEPGIEYARDLFILSFMLRGMSLIDMAFLKKSDLKGNRLVYRRRKTGQQLIIEWTPDMQAIVDKYPIDDTEYLLPIIRNPYAVPLYAYRNAGYRINRRLRQVAATLELKIPLTMYVARHSWASAARAKGIPVSVISEGMGHDSELTTQIYLASLDTTIVDRANSMLLRELNK